MLEHTKQCLMADKRLNVVYLGGSITEGSGASRQETCWVELFTKWLRETWPDCKVNSYNSGIGATGSDLGVFRCDRHVTAHAPDLLLVEYAVNDYPERPEDAGRNLEGIIRKVRTAYPECDILYFALSNMEMDQNDYEKGKVPETTLVHERVADYYGIPHSRPGQVLFERIQAEGCPYETYMPDTVHPNDVGYQIYFECIRDTFLQCMRVPAKPPAALPAPLYERQRVHAVLVDPDCIRAPGWTFHNEVFYDLYPSYIEATQPGAGFDFAFEGDAIGLCWDTAHDSGDIEWAIDDGPYTVHSAWDSYALEFDRPRYCILAQDFAPGKHILHLRISERNHPQSKGHTIRIAQFLVNPTQG